LDEVPQMLSGLLVFFIAKIRAQLAVRLIDFLLVVLADFAHQAVLFKRINVIISEVVVHVFS
jgi:hypothetical protein